jgi:DUF971 family protein
MSARLLPTHIAQVGEELAIAWNDGTECFISLEALRRYCPCAMCGGEPDVLGRIERPEVHYTPRGFLLRGYQIVGGYALQPGWEDGHSTGLYTFPYLKKIAEAAAHPAS